MAFRIANLSVPGPGELLGIAQGVISWSGAAVSTAAGLPARVSGLLDEVERLVELVQAVAKRAEDLMARADLVVGAGAQLVETYQPMAEKAAPLARRLLDQLTEQELIAAVQLVDQLPALTEHMQNEIRRVRADIHELLDVTKGGVGPDIHELLDVTKEVRHSITGIPGVPFFQRRGEERADEGPDRGPTVPGQ